MRIEHMAFNVPDPVAMTQWYEQYLGMKTVRSSGPPHHMRFVADASGQTMLELYRNPKAAVPDYRTIDPLIMHLAFLVDDVAVTRAGLLEAGATAEGEISKTDSGDRLAMLRDPWGFAIQLVNRAVPMLPK
jgi:catechol 2,3-dioxygenase-like lactoylglutathione lyase family enzyme